MAIEVLTGSRPRVAGGLTTLVKKIPINTAPTGAIQNTNFTLPAKAVVFSVYLDVRVAEATGTTKTIDVGRTSDPNGYLAAIDVSTTGVKKGTLVSTGQTLGALLSVDESGAGVLVPEADAAGGGEIVVYDAGSNDWVEFRGDIYVEYQILG